MATAPIAADRADSNYREWTIWVVSRPVLGADAVTLEWEGRLHTLDWSAVVRSFAAEVGEPEGVRTVVFDLVWADAPEGPAVVRFSVDPSEGPKRPAQQLVDSLGDARCSASLRCLAREGQPSDRYSHVDLLDEALLESLSAGV